MFSRQTYIGLLPLLLAGGCGVALDLILGPEAIKSNIWIIECESKGVDLKSRALMLRSCLCERPSRTGRPPEGPWVEVEEISCAYGNEQNRINLPGAMLPEVQKEAVCQVGTLEFRYDTEKKEAILNDGSKIACLAKGYNKLARSTCECW